MVDASTIMSQQHQDDVNNNATSSFPHTKAADDEVYIVDRLGMVE